MFSKAGVLKKAKLRAGHVVWHMYFLNGHIHEPTKLVVGAKNRMHVVLGASKSRISLFFETVEHYGTRERSYGDCGVGANHNQNRIFKNYKSAVAWARNLVLLGARIDLGTKFGQDVLKGLPGFSYDQVYVATEQVHIAPGIFKFYGGVIGPRS